MKIIDYFKEKPRLIQILDIIFIICLVYEIILLVLNIPQNSSISTMTLFAICISLIFDFTR